MKIVFHGSNASMFRAGIEDQLESDHDIRTVSDALDAPGEADVFAGADVIVGIRLSAEQPVPEALRLYQAPAAGIDAIDLTALPSDTPVCNSFGHENAIAEYVMSALLARHVPLADADARLRAGDWHYGAGGKAGLRTELGSQSIGIVGMGHIGRTLAARAAAFGMQVHGANRSPIIETSALTKTYALDSLHEMLGAVDIVVNTLPLTDETRGMIGAAELAAMKPDAVIVNVGRGPVIDEDALYEALSRRAIGGAVIDTWYVYPSAENPGPTPSTRPFQDLDNVVMTPHMSGWTKGMADRRRATIAENINRLERGDPLVNRVR